MTSTYRYRYVGNNFQRIEQAGLEPPAALLISVALRVHHLLLERLSAGETTLLRRGGALGAERLLVRLLLRQDGRTTLRLESILTDVARRAPVRGRELFKVTVAIHVAAVDACRIGKRIKQSKSVFFFFFFFSSSSFRNRPRASTSPRWYTDDDGWMDTRINRPSSVVLVHKLKATHLSIDSIHRFHPSIHPSIARPIASRPPSHRYVAHRSPHAHMYGVVSTAPPEAFPPPKLKKARVGVTVLLVVVVRRRPPLVETVDRVVTLVPVANADAVVVIAIIVVVAIVVVAIGFALARCVRRHRLPTLPKNQTKPNQTKPNQTKPHRLPRPSVPSDGATKSKKGFCFLSSSVGRAVGRHGTRTGRARVLEKKKRVDKETAPPDTRYQTKLTVHDPSQNKEAFSFPTDGWTDGWMDGWMDAQEERNISFAHY